MAALVLLPFVPVSWQPQAKTPVFHASTHLVQINVMVRDRSGHPVADLSKDDFVVTDRGKPETISFLSEFGPNRETRQQRQSLPPNTFSDEAKYHSDTPGVVTIILLDNLNTLSSTSPQPYETTPFWLEDHALANAKNHLIEFLKQLDSGNRVAIYGLSDTLHVLCDFTCSRDQLLAIVTKYDPTSKTRREAVEPGDYHTPIPGPFNPLMDADTRRMAAMNNQARAQTTMAALSAIAAHVADIPARKNLLWLTANLPFSSEAIVRILDRGHIIAYPVDARGLLPMSQKVDNITGVDEQASVFRGVYSSPYDQGPAPSRTLQPIGIDAMRQMAEATGGRAFVDTNDLTGAIRTVVEDSAFTYSLGFYVDPSSLDGKFHPLKVEVKRPGLTVVAQKGYFAFQDEPATEGERQANFLAALRSPLDSSAIPLEIKVDRLQQPQDSLQIVAALGIGSLQFTEGRNSRSGVVDVYVVEQDVAGNILQQAANHIRLKLSEQQYRTYLGTGIGFRQLIRPEPKATTVRVIVQDPNTSQVGSVIIPLSDVK